MQVDINLDYSMAIKNAERIRELSDDVLSINAQIRGISEETEECWKGEAGEAYRVLCAEAEEYFKNLSIKLSALADKIKVAAENIKTADEDLAAEAESIGN